jgi:hypothetical protein
MNTLSSKHVTQFILAWGNGGKDALNQLIPTIFGELNRPAWLHEEVHT